jgi:hypothetical protein
VTDDGPDGSPAWQPVLAKISRASGHEIRNALNALVVNLEVVRSRTDDESTSLFIRQAVEQSEESVRLAEAAVALLALVTGAIDSSGRLRCDRSGDGAIEIETTEAEAERAVKALKPLADRGAVSVDSRGATVILSIR